MDHVISAREAAHDSDAGAKHRVARDVLVRAASADCVLTLQVWGETFNVLRKRLIVPIGEAVRVTEHLRDVFPVFAADAVCLAEAMDIVRNHRWSFRGAMILTTGRRAGCRLLLTEDGQDGRSLHGVAPAAPFTEAPSPLIEQALAGA